MGNDHQPLYQEVKEEAEEPEATDSAKPTEPTDGKQAISGTANTAEYTITYVLDGVVITYYLK